MAYSSLVGNKFHTYHIPLFSCCPSIHPSIHLLRKKMQHMEPSHQQQQKKIFSLFSSTIIIALVRLGGQATNNNSNNDTGKRQTTQNHHVLSMETPMFDYRINPFPTAAVAVVKQQQQLHGARCQNN